MSLLADDRLTQLAFSVFHNKGVYALLLGSGVSRAADIPTGWEITLDLVRRVALAQGVQEQPDWGEWYHQKKGANPEYSKVIEELGFSRGERRAILHSYIEPTDDDRESGRKLPTQAHRAIAQLVASGFIRVIITTNFDRLLETALRDAGIEPTVITSVDAMLGAEPLTHTACYILKLHGDYKDARIKNTEEELGAYPDEYNGLLDRIFDEHGLIVAGWSGTWDDALRKAFLRAKNRRYSTYWATKGDMSDDAKKISDHRRSVVFDVQDADTFFSGLQERVETIRLTARQNPVSVEMTVARAKRYLAEPKFQIQLDDLINETGESWLDQIPDFGTEKIIPSEWALRAQKHEAASEKMAKVCLALGRWGSGQELDTVLNFIAIQISQADKIITGETAQVGLRSYPAVLVFTSYSLGLIRSGRLEHLHHVFNFSTDRPSQRGQRLVEILLNDKWYGTWNNIWRNNEEFKNSPTAFTDAQTHLFKNWGKSILGNISDFDFFYEQFEFLGSLAYFEGSDLQTLENRLANQKSNPQLVWMPLGRFTWNRDRLEKLVEMLHVVDSRNELLKCGFGRGQTRYLQLFLKNLELCSESRWTC